MNRALSITSLVISIAAILSIASFVISIAAMVIAISGRFSTAPVKPDPAQVRAAVDADLQRRETELVTAWAPKFRMIYKLMAEVPLDPWGTPYQLRNPGSKGKEGYDVFSADKDRKAGTEDDIGNW